MPKVNLNNALAGSVKPTENRKKVAQEATDFMTAGNSIESLFEEQPKLDVHSIDINKIRPREINEFSVVDVSSLAESIYLYGLINPISVVHQEDTDVYIISSGHRRFKAIQKLHEQYPEDDRYKNVDCCVYEVTTDKFRLAQGLPYITKEQEEGIYRDSNLQSRQLSYKDVAHQIRYIVDRFDDEEYYERLRRNAKEHGIETRSDADRVKLIVSVLSTQNYSGWSREVIRQYLKIKEAQRNDLITSIENEGMKVTAAYKQMIKEENHSRNRKTNKLNTLMKAKDAFVKEAEKRKYNEADLQQLSGIIAELQKVIDENETR